MLRPMSDLTAPGSPAAPEPIATDSDVTPVGSEGMAEPAGSGGTAEPAGSGGTPEPVPADVDAVEPDPERNGEFVEHPAKVMRIGSMIKQLLDEVRSAPLDEKSRVRLKEIYETSISELAAGLSPDLSEELATFTTPFSDDAPSEAELRIAQAQLVGWLEGLFHGIQATLFAQQVAEKQVEEMRRRSLPAPAQDRSGTYL